MIEKIRKMLPSGLRAKLKEMTSTHPLLTFFIALSYGFILKPYRNPYIMGKDIPKMFVIPDIYAIDCANDIFIKRIYERFYHIKKGDVVVDAGANVGMFTVKAAESVGENGKVVAVEPVEENFRLLEKNVAYRNFDNVTLVKKALGAYKGKAKFIVSKLSGTHQVKDVIKEPELPKNEVEIEMTTLGDICKELNLHRIDFLKLDIEGAELEALKGAEESLKITRNIAMELHYDGEDEEVKRFLEERGFDVKVIGSMLYATNTSIR